MGFGYIDEIKCPLCQHEFTYKFGITHYYYIEQLEEKYKKYSYTEVKCPSCKKHFGIIIKKIHLKNMIMMLRYIAKLFVGNRKDKV